MGGCRERKERAMSIEMLVRETIDTLKSHGIMVHKYESKSSSSVYLKLDGGLVGSVRFSDHKGKEQYSYMFNMLLDMVGTRTERQGAYVRHYYGPANLQDMIVDIVRRRVATKVKFRRGGYEEAVILAVGEMKRKKGFGEQCVLA